MTHYNQMAPGTVIGDKYKLNHLIGVGGMGAVYHATQVDLGRKVAIKFLHPQFCADHSVIERFQREAQLAASIGHDNICEVTDIGTNDDGTPYLVMPVLKGRSLSDVLKSVTLGYARICDIMGQVLYALEAAHVTGVVHRDLKPDNIFISQVGDRKDFVKLLDFGVSKVMESDKVKALTTTGTVLGTPAYMSPEQARGDRDVDHRMDIYAAGVIMYEALTGKRPYDGKSYSEIIIKIVTEPYLNPRRIDPEIPKVLEKIVVKAMAKEPPERYANAKEMAQAIEKASNMADARTWSVAKPGLKPAPHPLKLISGRNLIIPLAVLGSVIAIAGLIIMVQVLKAPQTSSLVAPTTPPTGGTAEVMPESKDAFGQSQDSEKKAAEFVPSVSRPPVSDVRMPAPEAKSASTPKPEKPDTITSKTVDPMPKPQTAPLPASEAVSPPSAALSKPEPSPPPAGITSKTVDPMPKPQTAPLPAPEAVSPPSAALSKPEPSPLPAAITSKTVDPMPKPQTAPLSAPEAVSPPSAALSKPEPSPPPAAIPQTYSNMSQLKAALKKGEISRAEYKTHQKDLKQKRAAELDHLKRLYQARDITRNEYTRSAGRVRQKYEYGSAGAEAPATAVASPSAPTQAPAHGVTPLLDPEAYNDMQSLKTALKQGRITRSEYAAHQAKIRQKRAAEYERLKAEYRAGNITRGEYKRRVAAVRRKYEGN
jgi:serine/threonine-protein kinase